jgi:hypothetical protein
MNHQVLYQVSEEISKWLPCLNSWQVDNVALFSQGIILAQSCQQQPVARQVATAERVESCARRWRRFLDNKSLPLAELFGQWSRWVIEKLDQETVYLLVDETKLGDRLAAMVVGVAWEGRCLPLAWRCYRANSAADYPAEGQVGMITALLRAVQAGLGDTPKVIVLADRGLGTSPALCRAVAAMGWSYLFRITCQSKICTPDGDYTIAQMVTEGESWSAVGRVFKTHGRVPARAIATWSTGYDQPWALVTNESTLTGFEYAYRNWQEQAFRDLKSGGWQWQSSRISHPDHLERLLLLLAVAYGWCLALGSHAVRAGRSRPLQTHVDGQRRRHWSLFREGLQFFFEVIHRGLDFIALDFVPVPRVT